MRYISGFWLIGEVLFFLVAAVVALSVFQTTARPTAKPAVEPTPALEQSAGSTSSEVTTPYLQVLYADGKFEWNPSSNWQSQVASGNGNLEIANIPEDWYFSQGRGCRIGSVLEGLEPSPIRTGVWMSATQMRGKNFIVCDEGGAITIQQVGKPIDWLQPRA